VKFYKEDKNTLNCALLFNIVFTLCILLYRIGFGGNKLFVFVFVFVIFRFCFQLLKTYLSLVRKINYKVGRRWIDFAVRDLCLCLTVLYLWFGLKFVFLRIPFVLSRLEEI
jgi:hypothetical protein